MTSSNLVRYAGIAATALAWVTVTACGHGAGSGAAHGDGSATATLAVPPVAAAEPTPATAPPASAPAGPITNRPVARHTVDQCGVDDVTLSPIVGDGAMGHVGYHIVVTNTSGSPCRLPAEHPVFIATNEATGRTGVLPTQPASTEPPAAMTIAPGARAETILWLVNGYGGYDPSDPACANPAVYRDVAVRLSGGALPLTGLVLDVKCDGVTAYDWAAPPAQANAR